MRSAKALLSEVRTRTCSEDGSANLLAFIICLVILIPAFVMFMHINGAKTARTDLNWQTINTAKAAASQTYTTETGELRIDLAAAQAKATDVYSRYRPSNVSYIGARLMDQGYTPRVTVACAADGWVNGSTGPQCVTVDVTVVDRYGGTFLTTHRVPGFEMTAVATATVTPFDS